MNETKLKLALYSVLTQHFIPNKFLIRYIPTCYTFIKLSVMTVSICDWQYERYFLSMCRYIHGTRHMSMTTGWHFAFCRYRVIPMWSPSCFISYINLTFIFILWFLEILYTLNSDLSWPTICHDSPRSFLRIWQLLSWS